MPKGNYERKGHASNFKDLTGQRFGKRVVLGWHSSPVYRGKKGSSLWSVRCDCGKESVLQTSSLKSVNSCGCDLEFAAARAVQSGITRKSPIPKNVRENHSHRQKTFGLSPEAFENLKQNQGNKCKICERPFDRTPHVDHDHACCSGKKSCGKCVRGLLCHHCNAGLGNFRDNSEVMLRAIAYLGNHVQETEESNSRNSK